MARSRGIVLCALSAIVMATGVQLTSAFAEGGDLDTTYGNGGSATSAVSNSVNRALFTDSAGDAILTSNATYLQWDASGQNMTTPMGATPGISFMTDSTMDSSGRIIVIGEDANGKLRVARYANAALDTTFGGGNGWTALSLNYVGSLVAAAPDGSLAILAGGQITKLTSTGALDTTWNAAGTVPGMAPYTGGGYAMAFQSSGDLVIVCGMDWGQNDPCLARYLADGTPDATFGSSGRGVRPPIDSSHQLAYYGLAIASDDTIYAGGSDVSAGQLIVTRLAADGTLDETWGTGGVVADPFGQSTLETPRVWTLLIAPDGGVYAGTTGDPSPSRTIIKYTPTGARDAGIGADGLIRVPDPNGVSTYDGLALQPDGGLLVSLPDPSTIRISRYTTTGMAAPTGVGITPTATGVHAHWTNPVTASFARAEVRLAAATTTAPTATTGVACYTGTGNSVDIGLPQGLDEAFAVLARDYAGNPSSTTTVLFHGTRFAAIPTSVIRYGTRKVLSTTLRRVNGTAVSGAAVTVYGKRHGTATWSKLGSATSTSSGVVTFSLAPGVNEDVLFRFAGAHSDLHSDVTTLIEVAPAISATWSHSSMPLGTTTRVSGTVAPNEHGQVVYLQRYYNRAWHTVTHIALTSSSTYAFSVKPGTRGYYYFRIYKPADAYRVAGATPTYRISVT